MARAPRVDEDAVPLPEPDRVEGAPHPRETARLYGQRDAEAAFLAAFNAGRMHHAWLLTGAEGLGKATLAWRIARFLLAAPADDGGMFGAPPPPATLDVDASDPVHRRITALSEPRLSLLRRGPNDKRTDLMSVISVDEVRAMKKFFTLSAADGGRRVAIVDAADDLNPAAANALLKILEEPPKDAIFLIVAHQPARLLPTIRSRCRALRLSPLSPPDMAAALDQAGVATDAPDQLAALAGGSVGAAIRLARHDGLALYRSLLSLAATLPRLDRPRALALAEAAGKRGAEAVFDLTVTLVDLMLARLARQGTTATPAPEAAPGEAALFARLCPDAASARGWADLAHTLGARARAGRAVNLDPSALLLDMLLKLESGPGSRAFEGGGNDRR
ncbi:MAG: DNA polymerase III subunit delta' [Gemmobacter sp.]